MKENNIIALCYNREYKLVIIAIYKQPALLAFTKIFTKYLRLFTLLIYLYTTLPSSWTWWKHKTQLDTELMMMCCWEWLGHDVC